MWATIFVGVWFVPALILIFGYLYLSWYDRRMARKDQHDPP